MEYRRDGGNGTKECTREGTNAKRAAVRSRAMSRYSDMMFGLGLLSR